MSRTFKLDIITPTSMHELGETEYLRAPGYDGLFGVEGGHASALITLDVGEIKVTSKGSTSYWATSGGFAEINGESVQLLLETAEPSSKIDMKRAESSVERAKKRIKDTNVDQARSRASIARAENRLKVSVRQKK